MIVDTTKINELKSSLEELDNKISELSTLRSKISCELYNASENAAKAEFDSWGIREGTCILLLAKSGENEFYLCRTIKVTTIHDEDQYFRCITGNYFMDYDSKQYKLEEEWISYSTLFSIKDAFHVLIINPLVYNSVVEHLCELSLDRHNLKAMLEQYELGALKIIQ